MTSPLDRVAELAALLGRAGLDELELIGPDGRIFLRRRGGAVGPIEARERGPDEEPGEAGFETVASTGVGHFLHAHPLHEAPLVRPDDAVAAGQPLGLLRVGALLLPVPAPRDGIVARIVAADGVLVGWGDPLVELWPEED